DDYWVEIPAGDFNMGSTRSDDRASLDEIPQQVIFLDSFLIGRYEITNGQWEQCVRAGICSPKYADPSKTDHPVVNLNWFEAQAFCTWIDGRLPTEAEWEKAARGSDARQFPWGDTSPNQDLANYNGYVGDTTPVGSYPDGVSPYGLYDMAGNAWEWVGDWYQEDYYQSRIEGTINPEGPPEGEFRVLRGGNKDIGASGIRVASQDKSFPTNTFNLFGFRCVRSP
ncbi:MAG TPA: SUMF1/EgtB/PvdO family nonheme iron enzyme, partial [Cyclobacteriaceae bacterium]|nr:SUMF1/EgtB/PvdO family nonheme iron enzyme [Cyclobacteriaceae bacterium]